MNTRKRLSSNFLDLRYSFLGIQRQKNLSSFEWTKWNNRVTLSRVQRKSFLQKLAFTSPDVISTSPKNVLFFCYSNSSYNITCPSGKLKTEFISPIAKSSSPGLSDTTFFARCVKWRFRSRHCRCCLSSLIRGTQREYSSKPLRHSIVKRFSI